MFQTKAVAKIKRFISYLIFFFSFEGSVAYVIMFKNIVQPDRSDMTI